MSILTTEQYLALSTASYGSFSDQDRGRVVNGILQQIPDSDQPQGKQLSVSLSSWVLYDYTENSSSGFSSSVFEAPSNAAVPKQLVFSFRGTADPRTGDLLGFFSDLDDNLLIATGTSVPSQFLEAYAFVKATIEAKVGNGTMTDAQIGAYVVANNVEFTGHSLGGGIAQYLTYRTGGAATTFNAVGIGQISALNINPQDYGTYNVTDYVNSSDVIGNFGQQLGTTHYVVSNLPTANVDVEAVAQVVRITFAMNLGLLLDVALGSSMIASLIATMNNETKAYLASQQSFAAHGLETFVNTDGSLKTHNLSGSYVDQIVVAIQDRASDIANITANYVNAVQQVADGIDNLDTASSVIATGTATFVTSTTNAATASVQDVKDGIDAIVSNRSAQLYSNLASIATDAGAIATEIDDFFDNIYSDSVALLTQTQAQLNQTLTQAMSQYSSVLSNTQVDDIVADIAKRMLQGIPPDAATLQSLAAAGVDLAGDLGEVTVDAIVDSVTIIANYFDQQRAIIETHLSDTIADIIPHVTNIVGSTVDVVAVIGAGAADLVVLLGSEIADFGEGFITSLTTFGGNVVDGLLTTADGILQVVDGLLALGSATVDAWFGSGAYQNLASWWAVFTGNFGSTDPNSSINGTQYNDILFGYGGDNYISAGDGNDIVYAGAGNDILHGGYGHDTLRGEAGDDLLIGDYWDASSGVTGYMSGNDILDGGAGNDTMYGGGGNDTYIFGRGYGTDTLWDYSLTYFYNNPGNGGFDTIQFLPGVSSSDIFVERIGDALKFSILGTSDSITALRYFDYYGSGVIEQAVFSDGTVWNEATLRDKARYVYGSSQDDTLAGFNDQNDIIYGYAGNDTIMGWAGNDIIYGGAGNDILMGGDDSDTLYGGDGDDILYGGNSDNYDGYFVVNTGHDILDGGAGNDLLEGGSGNDTYIFGRGYGHDIIHDRAYDIIGSKHAGFDTLQFLEGVLPSDIQVHRYGSDIQFKILDTGETITVLNHYSYNQMNSIDQVVFADSTVWDMATINAKAFTIFGTENNDSIPGYGDQPNYIYAGDGDDVISGSQYDDKLYGQAGNDTLSGGSGADILDGGTGNDMLIGGGGNDTYIFGRGYGQDVIDDKYRTYEYNNWGSGGALDTISMLEGVNPEDVEIARVGNNLEVRIIGTSDKITVLEHFNSNGGVGIGAVEQIIFADNTVWDISTIMDKARTIRGTASDDTISGYYNQNNIIYGGAGNDVIYGSNLEDTIHGEAGDDMLYGGAGNDTYVFGLGDGHDTIRDYVDYGYSGHSSGGANDSIQFTADIAPVNVMMRRFGYDLDIQIIGTLDRITVVDHFKSSAYTIENIKFANDVTWNLLDISKNAIITGTSGNDSLSGANDGHTFDAGAGDDYIQGGTGSDTYLFAPGFGVDRIYDNDGGQEGSFDIVTFAQEIDPNDITVRRLANDDLELTIANSGDKLIVERYFSTRHKNSPSWITGENSNAIEEFRFADNTVWDIATIRDKARYINGTSDSETINGFDTNDIISGFAGNDTINGNDGDDILIGGAGNDTLSGGAGNDTYIFNLGDGQDTIYESGGVDTIQFGEGIDPSNVIAKRISSGGSYPVYHLELSVAGTTDKITIYGYFGYYSGGGIVQAPQYVVENITFADSTAWTAATIDYKVHNISGTSGNDNITAYDDGAVSYYGLEGNDTLTGAAGNDILDGGAGDDNLSGNGGNDTLIGGTGNDTLSGGAGDDTYVFNIGDGQDIIYESSGTDTILFGAGIAPEDVIVKRVSSGGSYPTYHLELSIVGGSDKITVYGYFGYYSGGGIVAAPQYVVENIKFADDTTWTVATIDEKVHNIVGTSGDDNISVFDNGAVTYYGMGGNDTLTGGAGNDNLYGGEGNDTLYGNGGNDVLVGGVGNDYLSGGAGDDTYIFNLGDGQDTIYESSGIDTIQFGANINPEDITVRRVSTGGSYPMYNLELSIVGTTDKITVQYYFGATGGSGHYAMPDQMIEYITFADSTVWTQSTIYDKVHNISGTAGNDNISAYDAGAVTYHGLAGDDTLTGSTGNDTLYGDEGNDTLYGNGGNDTLVGGTGNDYLSGGAGDDTYIFALGDGQDTIYETSGTDAIVFGEGIDPEDVIVKRVSTGGSYPMYNLELSIAGTNDKITVQYYFGATGGNGHYAMPDQMIESIVFADNTVWTQATIYEKVHNITGTNNADTISAYDNGAVTYHGLGGNDTLNGGAGDDTLYGDEDNDTLYGNAGNDILVGGTGNDYLSGGAGDDTYVFNIGDGQDTIYETSGTDTIQFGAGIAPEDVIVKRVSSGGSYPTYNLELSIAGTNDKITVQSYFGATSGNGFYETPSLMIEYITFADNTTWTQGIIYDKVHNITGTPGNDTISAYDTGAVTYHGLAGDDTLTGSSSDDTLYGDEGNDTLYGNAGNDTLVGGTGNDYLSGGAGDDIYVFSLGDGQDTIYETSGTDTIQFGAGINPEDIIVKRVSSGGSYPTYNLELSIVGTSDKIIVQSYFGATSGNGFYATPNQMIENIMFADNTTWTQSTIYDKVHNITGTSGADGIYAYDDGDVIFHGLAGDDVLSGAGGNDTLYGDEGNDTLYGGSGHDLLNGGTGNDTLYGGTGNDTYVFTPGDGQDIIMDDGGNDLVQLNRSMFDVVFERSGNNLVVKTNNSTDTINVNHWYSSNTYKIEEFEASDGYTISDTQVEQLIQAMATFSANNSGMTWSQALASQLNDVQSVVSQYWTAPTA